MPPIAGAPMLVLRLSPRLREEVDRLIGGGMGIVAAIRRLAETRSELFVGPGDEIARLVATADTELRDEPHRPASNISRGQGAEATQPERVNKTP